MRFETGCTVIDVHQLTKAYGAKLAVDDLSFSVRPGVVTGFLGPNGSGKSTTMRAIMGLDRPTSGHAFVNGVPYAQLRWPLREVGALLEAKAIHPSRSAYNHLLMQARTNDIPAARVNTVLELVGLSDVARRRAGKFSLGMGQRLGIASVLLGDPAVMLFDEPINGLDPEGIRWVRVLLKRLAAEGRTVLVSSHLMGEMALTADELIVIGRGSLISAGPMAEFIENNSEQHVRVRTTEPELLAGFLRQAGGIVDSTADGSLRVTRLSAKVVGDTAIENGIGLHELSPQTASLEEAFMELTDDSIEYRGTMGGSVEHALELAGVAKQVQR
jgi:ABC-2 type transport system ATP-binding protein